MPKFDKLPDESFKYGFEAHGTEFIKVAQPAPCAVCGELTRWIDVDAFAFICSDECKEALDKTSGT